MPGQRCGTPEVSVSARYKNTREDRVTVRVTTHTFGPTSFPVTGARHSAQCTAYNGEHDR